MRILISWLALLISPAAAWGQTGFLITTQSPLLNGAAGSFYSATFTTSNGKTPVQWSVARGSALPQGLSLDGTSGVLSGTPVTPGSYMFTIQAQDAAQQTATKAFTLTIQTNLTLQPESPLRAGIVNQPYSPLTFTASGGTPPYFFTAQPKDPFSPATLPSGMTLSGSGVLSGTPDTLGTYAFNIVVSDRNRATFTKLYTITIALPLTFTTSSPLPDGAVGVGYSQTLVVSGGTPPYAFALIGSGAPGLALASNGVLSGTPSSAGQFTVTAQVTDSQQMAVSRQFALTIANSAPALLVSPAPLNFTARIGADTPPPQALTVLAGGNAPLAYAVVVDGGPSNPAAPSWLTVRPVMGMTPARLHVSVSPGNLTAGTYFARIRVSAPRMPALPPVDIPVTLVVLASQQAPQLAASPEAVAFNARKSAPGSREAQIEIRNIGDGGAVNFTTSLDPPVPWIMFVTGSGTTHPDQPAIVRVIINTQGLEIGGYRTSLRVSDTLTIPITLFVAGDGAILRVSHGGVRFRKRQGNGLSNPQTVRILNAGDPDSTASWKADIVQGGAWLSIDSPVGTATPGQPGLLSVRTNSTALALSPGGYYALIRIADPLARNSPQYVTAVLEVLDASTPPLPDPVPQGIVVTASAGGGAPPPQMVNVYTSSLAAVPFQAAAATVDGANWLSVSPATGMASTSNPGPVTVTFNPAGLAPGIYSGEIDFALAGSVRVTNVSLLVEAAGPETSTGASRTAGCVPSRLILTHTALVNNFSVPAGWPTPISVQLNDDCGMPALNGSVAATFSNGDPALMMRSDQVSGTYTATWQPGHTSQQNTITVRAGAEPLQAGSAQLTGAVQPNRAPVLGRGGTVNNLNPKGGLAPGVVAQVFGTDLASMTASPSMTPLPTNFNGTSVLVGGFEAPLYFASANQVNVQIPSELAPGQQYPIIVSANGALTLPDILDMNVAGAGVAAFPDGRLIAQHSDFTLVDAGHPAKPGEVLIMYLVGMGPTNPSVKSGTTAPGAEPFARVTVVPAVTVDGANAPIGYAGLTPGAVGLYQINFQVPSGARAGSLNVVVMQGGVAANVTTLPVAP